MGGHRIRRRQPVFLSHRYRRRQKLWRGMFCLSLVTLVALPGAHWATRFLYLRRQRVAEPFLHAFPLSRLGQRVLIVAPHPDDETLGCGGLIQKLVKRGVAIFVVIMTDGDGFNAAIRLTFRDWYINRVERRAFALMRRGETLKAMGALGVPEGQVFFLGFSERTLLKDWLLDGDLSPLEEMKKVIEKVRPTALFLPSRFDDHPVHALTYALTWSSLLQALLERRLPSLPAIWETLIHYGNYPFPQGRHEKFHLLPPPELLMEGQWLRLPLTPKERERKGRAISCYQTQLPLMGRFMKSFIRADEIFLSPSFSPVHRDRKGEPRSFLPAADILQLTFQEGERGAKVEILLRGKTRPWIDYRLHLFRPDPSKPESLSLPCLPERFSRRKIVSPLPPSLSPPLVFTAVTMHNNFPMDVVPFVLMGDDAHGLVP